MCSEHVTDLKLQAADKLIAMSEIEVQKNHLLRRTITVHGQLCAAQTTASTDRIRLAQLMADEKAIAHEEAGLDLEIARLYVELEQIMTNIKVEMGGGNDGLLSTLLGAVFGGLSDIGGVKGGFGSTGPRDHMSSGEPLFLRFATGGRRPLFDDLDLSR